MKIARVVTNNTAVIWHLHNTIIRSHDHDLIIVGDCVSIYKKKYPNVKFYDIKIKRKPSLLSDLIALKDLYFILRNERPDIVHSIMPKAGLISSIASYLARIEIRLHTFTGQVWVDFRHPKRFFYIMLDKLVILLNTQCLTDSESQSIFLEMNGVTSVDNKKLPYLGYGSLAGIEFDKIKFHKYINLNKKKLKSIYNFLDTDYIISYIARKTLDKGALDILKIFEILYRNNNRYKLLFIGPIESEFIESYFNSLPPEIKNAILCKDVVSDYIQYLLLSDVLCCPSHREGFGTIVVESHACGTPVVGYNIYGLTDSIGNMHDLLVEENSIQDFAIKIDELVANEIHYKVVSDDLQTRALTKFSADYLYSELTKFYKIQYDLIIK